jgi:hypothetical protein
MHVPHREFLEDVAHALWLRENGREKEANELSGALDSMECVPNGGARGILKRTAKFSGRNSFFTPRNALGRTATAVKDSFGDEWEQLSTTERQAFLQSDTDIARAIEHLWFVNPTKIVAVSLNQFAQKLLPYGLQHAWQFCALDRYQRRLMAKLPDPCLGPFALYLHHIRTITREDIETRCNILVGQLVRSELNMDCCPSDNVFEYVDGEMEAIERRGWPSHDVWIGSDSTEEDRALCLKTVSARFNVGQIELAALINVIREKCGVRLANALDSACVDDALIYAPLLEVPFAIPGKWDDGEEDDTGDARGLDEDGNPAEDDD